MVSNAQESGAFICHYRLDGNGGGEQYDEQSELDLNTDGFSWLHLRSDAPDSIPRLQAIDIDPRVIEAITADETRPRMQVIAGGVLINLRGVNTNPGSDPEDMVSIRLWFRNNFIVSARRRERKLLSVEDIRKRIEDGTGPKSPGEFIVMLTEYMANRINDVVDSIDEDLSKVEAGLDESNNRETQNQLTQIRKQTATIRRYLAPQREALAELYRSRSYLTEQDSHSLQYQTDRIIHYVEDLDLAKERALVLYGELQNRIAEQQNSRMYLLSIVAAIFLPLSFLTGVFGMNVAGLPGIEYPAAFVFLVIAMVVIAIFIIGVMWWKKWL
jgi:zinc transporter